MNEPIIELRGIRKSHEGKEVSTGVDLSLPKGSVPGLLGTNGAEKTTIIKCTPDLLRP